MRKIKIILALTVIVLIVMAAWQIGAWEIANINLQEDMRDMASQAGTRFGVVVPPSDEELMRAVIGKAKERGIDLAPNQVTVKRTNPGEHSTLYLAADYKVPVKLPFVSFSLHFKPSAGQ